MFVVARFFIERDAGDRQQDDCFRNHAHAARSQHVSAFVRAHAGEDNSAECKITWSVCRSLVRRIVCPEDKHGQDEERQMEADIHAKQASNRDGPASHKRIRCFYSTWMVILVAAPKDAGRCA